uniref:Uncharacterized protein n=1 Tax=Peronospora matthiolae TaxID=2874970 RepID=A0AAV1T2S0_9STRA
MVTRRLDTVADSTGPSSNDLRERRCTRDELAANELLLECARRGTRDQREAAVATCGGDFLSVNDAIPSAARVGRFCHRGWNGAGVERREEPVERPIATHDRSGLIGRLYGSRKTTCSPSCLIAPLPPQTTTMSATPTTTTTMTTTRHALPRSFRRPFFNLPGRASPIRCCRFFYGHTSSQVELRLVLVLPFLLGNSARLIVTDESYHPLVSPFVSNTHMSPCSRGQYENVGTARASVLPDS